MKIYGMEFSNNEKVRNSLGFYCFFQINGPLCIFFLSLSVNFETTLKVSL